MKKNYKRGSRRLQSVWEVDVSRNVRFLRIKSSNLYTTIVFMRMILIPLRRLIVYVWQETRRRFWKEKGVHQILLKYGDIRKICNLTHKIIWIQSKLMKQFMIMVVWFRPDHRSHGQRPHGPWAHLDPTRVKWTERTLMDGLGENYLARSLSSAELEYLYLCFCDGQALSSGNKLLPYGLAWSGPIVSSDHLGGEIKYTQNSFGRGKSAKTLSRKNLGEAINDLI